ncbi:DUF5704 domain-containing protein [Paenibacillus alvei]
MLFKIELATQLNVKYFTTDGKSLNNIFTPTVNEEMTVGKEYVFTPPTHKDYEYVGFKKSTTDNDPAGAILRRDPDKFTYNGTHEKYTLHMYYQTKKTDTCKPGDPDCDPPTSSDCTDPAPSSTIDGKVMDPRVTAMIRADQRGNERFDVTQGIPTSESLYGNVNSLNYLFENKFVQKSGKCTFKVNVEKTYTLKWDPGKTVTGPDGKPKQEPDPQTETETKVFSVTVERPYSFWTIDTLHVLKIDEASLVNYALPNGGIKISPSGYSPPGYAASTRGNYYPPNNPGTVTATPETKTGGKTKPTITDTASSVKSFAEKAIDKVEVENDYLQFNGSTIMDNRRVKETGSNPGRIPEPTVIGQNVLYSPGNMISSSKVNKKDTPSSGKIQYGLMPGNVNGGENKEFPIYGINTITVHTPVVDYSYASDDRDHNQKTNPNMNRNAFILDRPFTVTIPTIGQHQNYLNYGNRDYAKWTKDRQVQFEFDVLSRKNDNSSYIPAGTWVSYPAGVDTLTFYTPVWVDEGDYNVYTRAIAENAPQGFTFEDDANMNWQNHVAARTLKIEVIGRVYDFKITDVADFMWENVFRNSSGSSSPTGRMYPVGDKDIDGAPNGFSFPYELPIRRGSNPIQGQKNVAVKLGYHFKFDLKSKGNLFAQYDSIRITPSFTFVDMNGSRQPVDLYYHDLNKSQYFIRVGSSADVQRRNVVLNERLRNVPAQTLTNTSNTLKNLFGSVPSWWKPDKPTYVGGYDLELITAPLRTFIGGFDVPAGVNPYRKNAGIQQWYADYSLPAKTYAVPKGTNLAEYGRTHRLNDKSPVFLKKGFIVVNFNIETIRNQDSSHPHLQYINTKFPNANQWKREGFKYQLTDPYGMKTQLNDGDVVFYHADKSSTDDFGQNGTH